MHYWFEFECMKEASMISDFASNVSSISLILMIELNENVQGLLQVEH